MAIKQLTQQQVREWTLEQKDRWWLENVYRGDMRQLTLRSAATGMLLGSVLSITNLYVGIKTGWTLGIGITSVVISFAIFKIFAKFNLGKEMTILENNAMQSIAASAGYMTMPLVTSLPAYMMVTGTVIPMWHAFCWTIVLALLGTLFAFPLKKRYINDEQLMFPEGYAAGMVLDNLHAPEADGGLVKAKFLGAGALLAAIIEFARNSTIMEKIGLRFMSLPSHWDAFIYNFVTPRIMGTPLRDLTIGMESSIILMGTGALISLRMTSSMLLGAVLNYAVLAPYFIDKGIIAGVGFKNISMWGLWGGAALMTSASLYSFLASGNIVAALRDLRDGKARVKAAPGSQKDILAEIELPPWVSYWGILLLGTIIVIMGHEFFAIDYWLGAITIPLVFVFTIMAVRATGLTSLTPGSTLGKLTQVTYSVLVPSSMGANLIAAGITTDVCLSASNLLMDIKPSYMLGGKPRHQAIGHALGIFAGGLFAIPVFYALFDGDISLFSTERFPLPAAAIWRAVAEFLANGISSLHPSAQIAVIVGLVLGVLLEIVQKRSHGRFPLSAIGLGLAFVLPFSTTLEFFTGSFIYWLLARRPVERRGGFYHKVVENREATAAGVIAGGSLIGIVVMILEMAG